MERKIYYSRESLLRLRVQSARNPNQQVPQINKHSLDYETRRMLFPQRRASSTPVRRAPPNWGSWRKGSKVNRGQQTNSTVGPSSTPVSRRPPGWGNWRKDTSKVNRSAECVESVAQTVPRVISRPTDVLDKPLQTSANAFVPSAIKKKQTVDTEQMFKRQLRLLLNKCSANNFEIIIAEFKQIAASAPNNGVVYFGSQLFDKLVFDKGFMLENYATLCTVIRKDQLDSFEKGFFARATELLPTLTETKEVIAVATFVAKGVHEKVLPLCRLSDIIELVGTENLRIAAKTSLLKKNSEMIAEISTELYDKWAFEIAWLIYERKLIKRLAFACDDAMKVARKIRRKAYHVYVMSIPDTCEAWFGR